LKFYRDKIARKASSSFSDKKFWLSLVAIFGVFKTTTTQQLNNSTTILSAKSANVLTKFFDVVMPRTTGNYRRLNPILSPTEKFDLLDQPELIICWNYFQFAATSGDEG
jgi:hypothetical protein